MSKDTQIVELAGAIDSPESYNARELRLPDRSGTTE
jgi:hypothetical protein